MASENLDDLSTEELRKRAFHLAEHRRDVRFFWDLLKHLPGSDEAASGDAFSSAGATVADFLELLRELRGHHLGDAEPMLRAHFVAYLQTHSGT